MRTSLVLTIIGDDKPGIVDLISDRVLSAGANWEESSMARLSGKFAGVLRVSVPSDGAEGLAAALRALDAQGLSVVVADSRVPEPPPAQHLHLSLVGNDRPGIVRDIARTLAAHQVNIEMLDTSVESAPMSGEALFHADAALRVPAGVTADELKQVLESLAGELMVDLSVDDLSD